MNAKYVPVRTPAQQQTINALPVCQVTACAVAMTHLAAVPGVIRPEGLFPECNPLGFFLTLDVGSSDLAALAHQKSPRLANPSVKVSRTAVLAVLVLTSKPRHISNLF